MLDKYSNEMSKNRHLIARLGFALGVFAILFSTINYLYHQDLIQDGVNYREIKNYEQHCEKQNARMVLSCEYTYFVAGAEATPTLIFNKTWGEKKIFNITGD